MSEEYQLTLNDYKAIVKRRWLYFVIPFVILLLISVAAAYLLPPVYSSSGTILIESQQISENLVKTPDSSFIDERIQIIQKKVTTRSNILEIIDKFDLLKEDRDKLTPSEQVDMVRQKISITKSTVGKKKKRNSPTIAFNLGYEDENPRLAYSVANELITMFLEENVKTRSKRATETTEFLSEEAMKLKQSLEKIEKQIADFKQENKESLPEHLDLHVKMLERTESGIKELQREIKAAQEENRFLEIELSAARKNSLALQGNTTVLTPEQELERLKLVYAELITQYTDAHPDVKAAKRRMKLLEKRINETPLEPEIEDTAALQGLDVARVQARIDSVKERISAMTEQIDEYQARRKELEVIILKTPQVERALVSLNRDYESTTKKYKELQSKEMEAKLAESLEDSKKAERFTLIEPPIMPDAPVKPDRKKIMLLGFVMAGGGSGGLVFLLEMLDKRIRGSNALTKLLKQRPLVSIPYITTESEIRKRRKRVKYLIIAAIVAVILSLVLVHFFYMPLDFLILKLMVLMG